MGFISDLIGGSAKGQFTPINGANQGQADTAYNQTQAGLQQQQAFLNNIMAQGGVQNQQNVYNQLQGVANGTGPNPAQAMLAQQTGANTANQAALMAGQRGSNANAGLLARQAGMQGGANQQNAVGQAASLQAQQSLGALGQLGGIAGQQVGQMGNALNSYQQSASQQQSNILNAIGGQNSVNASIAMQDAKTNSGIAGGLLGGAATALGMGGFGGGAAATKPSAGGGTYAAHGGQILPGGGVQGPGRSSLSGHYAQALSQGGPVGGHAKVAGDSYSNDTVPAVLSPGEIVIPRSVINSSNPTQNAANFVAAILAKKGR